MATTMSAASRSHQTRGSSREVRRIVPARSSARSGPFRASTAASESAPAGGPCLRSSVGRWSRPRTRRSARLFPAFGSLLESRTDRLALGPGGGIRRRKLALSSWARRPRARHGTAGGVVMSDPGDRAGARASPVEHLALEPDRFRAGTPGLMPVCKRRRWGTLGVWPEAEHGRRWTVASGRLLTFSAIGDCRSVRRLLDPQMVRTDWSLTYPGSCERGIVTAEDAGRRRRDRAAPPRSRSGDGAELVLDHAGTEVPAMTMARIV